MAADFEIQVSVLPSFVHIPDEVAMTFGDDAFLLADQVLRAGRITQEQYDKLKEIDEALSQMSGQEHGELWTLDALRSRPEWQKIRLTALAALDLLRYPMKKATLDWFTFVGSRPYDDPLGGVDTDSTHRRAQPPS